MGEIVKPDVPMDPACDWFREGDPLHRSQTLFNKVFFPLSPALVAIATVAVNNYYMKRPWFAGAHRFVIWGGLTFAGGLYMQQYKYRTQAERDMMLYHYMCLHPEDFPPPERVKFRDVLQRWQPYR